MSPADPPFAKRQSVNNSLHFYCQNCDDQGNDDDLQKDNRSLILFTSTAKMVMTRAMMMVHRRFDWSISTILTKILMLRHCKQKNFSGLCCPQKFLI